VPDEPAPVSGRGVRSKHWKGGTEHGKNRATTGRAMHVYVRGWKSKKADFLQLLVIGTYANPVNAANTNCHDPVASG